MESETIIVSARRPRRWTSTL